MRGDSESQDSARRRMAAGARITAGMRAAEARMAACFMRAALAFAAVGILGKVEAADVTVGPKSEKRVPIAVEPDSDEELNITPEDGWKLVNSSIAMQNDAALWQAGSKSADLHQYYATSLFSSLEFVHVDGSLAKNEKGSGKGGGAKTEPFHVTVPAVDLDWTGPGAPNDETVEDTHFVWVTDQTNQTFVVRKPDESKDDMFLWNNELKPFKIPDMRLTWDMSKLDVSYNDSLRTTPLDIPKRIWSGISSLEFKASRNTNATPHENALKIRLDRMSTPGDVNYQKGVTSGTYDEILYRTMNLKIIEPDGLPVQRRSDPNDRWLRQSPPFCFEWQYVHVDNEVVPYHLTQPIDSEVAPDIPNNRNWSVDKGRLRNPNLKNPNYLPDGIPIPNRYETATLKLMAFHGVEQTRILEIYRDHLERDFQNFGASRDCGAGSLKSFHWHFPRYGTPNPWMAYNTWNCFGSVWHAYNGTGNGFATAVPDVGFSVITYDEPIPWAVAMAGLRRGDFVSFYSVDPQTGAEIMQHAHTCMGTPSQMYGANNEPAYGFYSRRDRDGCYAPPWEGASWRWFVTSSETYYNEVNKGFSRMHPGLPQLISRIKVHKK